MPITFYSIVHIVSVILLAGITFSAIASRSEQAGLWRAVTFGAILIAVLMVELKPF